MAFDDCKKKYDDVLNITHLYDGIGNFGTGNNGVRAHHPVGIFLTDF